MKKMGPDDVSLRRIAMMTIGIAMIDTIKDPTTMSSPRLSQASMPWKGVP